MNTHYQNILRIPSMLFHRWVQVAHAEDKESFAFAIAVPVVGKTKCLFLVRQLLLPDAKDLAEQTATRVAPTPYYQGTAHILTCMQEAVLFDFHTHLSTGPVAFSGIDIEGHRQDAEVAKTWLTAKASTGSIVFNRTLDHFEGKVFIREKNRYEPIHALEILGSPTRILKAEHTTPLTESSRYHRQTLIPWLRQDLLADLHVTIVGLGGIGSVILQGLLLCGVGERGSILAVDPDRLEASNLSRIPYASPWDVGRPKVKVAARFARFRRYKGRFLARPVGIQDPSLQAELSESQLLIGCVDNEGGRRILDELALRYQIPYVDFGSEIFIDEVKHTDSGGQVRIVLPGQTGCLVCTGGIDMAQARRDLMSEEEKRRYARAGYIHGTQESPAPAVHSLNGVVGYLGLGQILKLLFGQLEGQTNLFYQLEKNQLLTAATEPAAMCPICGHEGVLGWGDRIRVRRSTGDSPSLKPFSLETHSSMLVETVTCQDQAGTSVIDHEKKPEGDEKIDPLIAVLGS